MKNIKFTKRTGLITIVLATVLGIGACSAHHGHPRNMNPEKILKRVTKKLDLNSLQQGKLRVVLESASEFKTEMSSKHEAFSQPLKQNLAQPTIDVDELNNHFDSLGAELHTFRRTMIDQYADFHASLNNEQREKLSTFMEKMIKHRKH